MYFSVLGSDFENFDNSEHKEDNRNKLSKFSKSDPVARCTSGNVPLLS